MSKNGYIVAIHDIAKPGHIEMLPQIFDSEFSVGNYVTHRLNSRVTIVLFVKEVQVPSSYNLVSF